MQIFAVFEALPALASSLMDLLGCLGLNQADKSWHFWCIVLERWIVHATRVLLAQGWPSMNYLFSSWSILSLDPLTREGTTLELWDSVQKIKDMKTQKGLGYFPFYNDDNFELLINIS